MSFALCPQVASQALQHFRSSETRATCGGCFYCQSVRLVTSFDSGVLTLGVSDSAAIKYQVKILQTWMGFDSLLYLESVAYINLHVHQILGD